MIFKVKRSKVNVIWFQSSDTKYAVLNECMPTSQKVAYCLSISTASAVDGIKDCLKSSFVDNKFRVIDD